MSEKAKRNRLEIQPPLTNRHLRNGSVRTAVYTPLPPMNPKVAHLRRQSAHRRYVRGLRYARCLWGSAGVLLLALLIEVVLALSFSPRFRIYRLEVTGVDSLTAAEVIRLAHLSLKSNYYRISLREVAERICTEPRVQSAAVRRLNVGVLGIEVTERNPVCRLGQTLPLTYLDADGYLFTRPSPPSAPVPVVEGISVARGSQPGKRLATDHVDGVLDCLAAMRGNTADGPPLHVARLVVSPPGDTTLVLNEGPKVFLGRPEDFTRKIWVVRNTIRTAQEKGYPLPTLEYIDAKIIERLPNPDDGKNGVSPVLGANFKPKTNVEAPAK